MYNVKYVNEHNQTFYFDGHIVIADFDFGNGVHVDTSYSQGFGQVGETTENKSVKGRTIQVRGQILGNNTDVKRRMRRIFSPFFSGKLIMNGYYINVDIIDTPTFSTSKNKSDFMMLFKAPYPFFKSEEQIVRKMGRIIKQFRFPVNYSTPHRFGTFEKENKVNLFVDSDVRVPLNLEIDVQSSASNIIIQNQDTLETLKINGSFQAGDKLKFYRDDNQILRCELFTIAKGFESIIGRIDDSSNLSFLNPADNIIVVTDDHQAAGFITTIYYRNEVVALYES